MTSENRKDHDKRTKNHALTLKTGPSVLFDMNEVTDSRTLDIQLIRDDVIKSKARPDKTVRSIELEFTSQVYRGVTLRHQAHIYLPDPNIPEHTRATAAVILGNGGISSARV